MKLFLFLLFPVSLFIFYSQKEKDNRAHLLPIIFIGFFTSSLFFAYKLLFSAFYHIPEAAFLSNFFYFLITQLVIPVGVIYSLFFFFAKKDSVKQRFSFFFPLIASFYSIYLPFLIVETANPLSAFYLFVKPILFLSLFIIIHIWLSKAAICTPPFKKKVCNIVFLVLINFIPAFSETAWIIGWNFFIWFIPSAILIAIAAILIFPKSTIKD